MLREFGQDLKRLRELKGISLAEISAETRINPKFLTNIENGIFDFQPEAYIRSFIKAYAKAINENENHLLLDYDKAKGGFYARRKFAGGDSKLFDDRINISVSEPEPTKQPEEPVYTESIKDDKPDYLKEEEAEEEKKFSERSITQKILLVILILLVAGGIYFLVDYLNSSGQKKTDVKPKSFNEISSEYENRISGKKDSVSKMDSLQNAASDSLRLMVKALKDITIKVYVDENKLVEEDLGEKDSLYISAKDQFRFSATGNQTVELYLNGKYLRKPASLSGTSIKNLVINKDGIVTQ